MPLFQNILNKICKCFTKTFHRHNVGTSVTSCVGKPSTSSEVILLDDGTDIHKMKLKSKVVNLEDPKGVGYRKEVV